jgi:hypothetical protein
LKCCNFIYKKKGKYKKPLKTKKKGVRQMSILADKIQRIIKEEDNKMRSLHKVRVESLKNEIARLEAICQKHNIGYKKAATKQVPARKRREAKRFFDIYAIKHHEDLSSIKYRDNIIEASTLDKLYIKYLIEWDKAQPLN